MSEKPGRSVRMTDDEAWAYIEAGHTGILTTLRANGEPIALPVWYATLDRRVYVSTRGKKITRARNDPRASFLVEAGQRWAELRAVHIACRARVLDDIDADLRDRVHAELGRKYGSFRSPGKKMPDATREHYKTAVGAIIELIPAGNLLSWDNARLRVT